MSLSIGIVGLPNVGKSTLFNALTKKKAEAANYPFCTIDPNVGVVKVPDERLEALAALSKPERIMPTTIEFVDIAGLVKGAHRGEGLGNQFLAQIRECDAVCEVVRNFEDSNIVHVAGRVDPADDRETIALELIMADLATAEKRLAAAARNAKGGGKDSVKEKDLLERLHTWLGEGKPARDFDVADKEETVFMKSLQLLSAKPIIYVLNAGEASVEYKPDWDGEVLNLNIRQEEEIASLPENEQKEYAEALGLPDSGLNLLIKASYNLLELITYFTTGPMETRAWTIKRGTKAPQAAGVIHTDFEQGFIRAEVISCQDFLRCGGEAAAREQGLLRTEGKEYVMQDGDICHFLFSN